MIISVNWLKRYVKTDVSVDKLAKLIGARLVEIESVSNLSDKYGSAIVSRVVTCVPHPNSDHLHICTIDDGGKADVERDENGCVQVVCGAPNVRAGLLVAWLPPHSIVPETYGKADELRLSDRKLRGVLSHGMLASPRELDLWPEHEGIMEVTDDGTLQSGDSLLRAYELDDYLLEVENKSLTHRPDCFGVIGFAREVAAILGQQMVTPQWFNQTTGQTVAKNDQVSVTITDPDLCARYECALVRGVDTSRQLPGLRRTYLSRIGARSINAVVDITNELMFDSGQPLHAFDYDAVVKLSPTGKADIIVRAGREGEGLELLDGRQIKLSDKDIVIAVGDANNSVPIALAGAMGGLATEVTDDTKNVLLESATFNLYNLRNTQFRHGIFSEAITRFTKGQPSGLTHPVLLRAIDLLGQSAGGELVGAIVESYPVHAESSHFTLSAQAVDGILGEITGGYSAQLIAGTLNNLQYDHVSVSGDKVEATAPWWRTDLHINEEVIEDIGRVNGYDDIRTTLPLRSVRAVTDNELYAKQLTIKERLRELGGNEVMTYSFVHGDLMRKVGDNPAKAFRIVNAISPNLQYCRRSLLPNLIESARDNLRAGYNDFMLFEVGKVHQKGRPDPIEPDLPLEIPQVAAVVVDNDDRHESAFFTVKRVMAALLESRESLTYRRLDMVDKSLLDETVNLYEPRRSAAVLVDGRLIGFVGEFKSDVRRIFKLPEFAAGLVLLLNQLDDSLLHGRGYTPVLRYQGTDRDITLQVSADVNYDVVSQFITKHIATLPANVKVQLTPVDIFMPSDGVKNITLHLEFHDINQTIATKLVNKFMNGLSAAAKAEIKANVI